MRCSGSTGWLSVDCPPGGWRGGGVGLRVGRGGVGGLSAATGAGGGGSVTGGAAGCSPKKAQDDNPSASQIVAAWESRRRTDRPTIAAIASDYTPAVVQTNQRLGYPQRAGRYLGQKRYPNFSLCPPLTAPAVSSGVADALSGMLVTTIKSATGPATFRQNAGTD